MNVYKILIIVLLIIFAYSEIDLIIPKVEFYMLVGDLTIVTILWWI